MSTKTGDSLVSITAQLHALGLHDLSTELTRERLAMLTQIAEGNTLRDELREALQDLLFRLKPDRWAACHNPNEATMRKRVVENCRAAIVKAK